MAELDASGQIWYPTFADGSFDVSKRPRFKRYLDEQKGTLTTTVWADIPPINARAQERLGYPTQKPLALLERILAASSNEGDVVLDPFCGCGTTVHAAQKMGRRWLGIDVTHLAVGLIQRRLRDAFPLAAFQVLGTPRDLGAAKALAEADKHQFQLWALSMIDNAVPYKGGRKGADGGVDGYVYFQVPSDEGAGSKTVTGKAIVSIKGGGVSDPQVKDLITTVDHEGAQMGLFITLLPPTKPMVARAAAAGFYSAGGRDYPKVQVLTIEQLFDGKRPEMPWLDPTVFKKAKREAAPSQQGALDL
jgi:site-specific DNA-methyltransferase (adenine-specific)